MTLEELGWNPVHERAWNEFNRTPHFPARVIETPKNSWRVASEAGESLMELSGRLRHRLLTPDGWPAVGDWVEAAGGTIYNVLPRRSKLSRRAAGRRTDEQIVAANVDTVFVVSSFDRDFNPRRLERYLTVVWEGGAQPVIVLNKADLCDETPHLLRETQAVALAVPVYAISAANAEGLDQLQPHLQAGSTIALVGSSGVGKSTLINQLCGYDRQSVRTVGTDGRGRHTTSARNLIALPSGALLIDTPGMRELQLWGTEDSLNETFQEIEHLARQCRFRDCRHTDEPGCAVLQAVKRGETPQERYDSYLKLRKELAFLHRKQDLSAELEQKRKWKAIHKAHRAMQKMQRKP
jgi:ribosome biogenesis GTPase / thiamine phosphate phosphatase